MTIALIWLLVGFGLILSEFVMTSFITVFFGIAAVIVAIAIWLGMPADGALPYVVFAGTSLALLFGLRSRFQNWFQGDVAGGDLDDDFIGREATVTEGFDAGDPGRGRIEFRGAAWDARASGGELSAGSHVKIVARHGTVLTVEPL
ncbi:MAG: NfeD family protein [Pseudomonadaceae bacterium]|nr:NfeD family protein [Pseudomonadaceae bacterium]